MPIQRFTAAEWLARPADRGDAGGTAQQRLAVGEICRRVAAEGDTAVREYSLRFDGWAPEAGEGWALGLFSCRALGSHVFTRMHGERGRRANLQPSIAPPVEGLSTTLLLF